mgnify:CR=1 FL=1
MKEIRFFGHDFVLHPAGILIWPQENLAVVADLHLEKASFYARHGQFLPPQESFETLRALSDQLEFCSVKKLILLGDSFHDSHGFSRMDEPSKKMLDALTARYEFIWVTGNHDKDFIPDNAEIYHDYILQNLTFRHEAVPETQGEISGHFHPKVRFLLKGQRINHPCFIADQTRMILPAYGTLTGGMDIFLPPFDTLFTKDFTAHILGKEQIYSIPSAKFLRK